MAKEKKRGFLSWFGRGRKEEEQPKDAEKLEQPVEPVEHAEAEAHVASEQHHEAPREEHAGEWDAAAVAEAEIVDKAHEIISEPQHVEPVVIESETVGSSVIEPEVAEPEVIESLPEAEPAIAEHQPEAEPAIIDVEPIKEVEPTSQVLAQEIVEVTEQVAAHQHLPEAVIQPEHDVPEVQDLPVAQEPLVSLPALEQQTEQERPTKEGFFARLKRSLIKTRQNLGSGFIGLFRGKKIDDELFEELEEQLLIADVGVETTRKIITSLTEHASRKQLKDAEALYSKLKEEMSEILAKVDKPLDVGGKTPYVILMVGVNGVGKTTTIGKLARQFEAEGKSVMLAAGDTFRAAAVEQLQVWGQRNNIPVIAQHTGADSASVIFDAIQAAKSRKVDVLIADTAGRLQNKSHLMEELKKIVRVMKKLDEDAPHEVMLTLDASTGQNAVSQARLFNEAVGLTGITLTKLDGTAKGGVIFAIADQFEIPIRYIGVGEGIEDLRPFKADDFIEALFARED